MFDLERYLFEVPVDPVRAAIFIAMTKDLEQEHGSLLGTVCSLLNMILLKITICSTEQSDNMEAAQAIVKRSVSLRLIIICTCFYFGFTLPFFNKIAVVLPLVFPRVAAAFIKCAVPLWQFARTKLFPAEDT